MKIAELFVRLTADTTGLNKGLTGAQRELDKFGKTAGRVAGLVGAGLFTGMVKNSIEAQSAIAQLNAVVKSTGGAAGFATPQLQAMASELQKVSTFSDEAIMGAQGLLLTFTKIGGAELQGATKAVLNLATAMGTDLKSAAVQVGKALNDPKIGLTALRRVGVSFSESQVAVIKRLQETGRVAEAQRLILKELEVEFGGSAEAARNTLGGALKALANAFGDTLEMSGQSTGGIVAALNTLADALPGIRSKIDGFFVWFNKAMIRSASLWQQLLANMRKAGLAFQQGIANSAQNSAFGKIREWGERLEARTMAEQDEIDGLISAIRTWEAAELSAASATATAAAAVIPMINGITAATIKATTSAQKLMDEWKKAKLEMELGSSRLAADMGAKDSKGDKIVKLAGGFADKGSAEAAAKAGKKGSLLGRIFSGPQNNDSMGTRVGQVLQAGGGGSEMGQMAQAFASFGPMAVLLPVINGAMEKLGPAFTKLIGPLVELGATIGEILAPVFEMLAPVIQLVAASFKVFQPVLKMVVKGFSYLMQGLGMVVKAVGKLIDSLPFVKAKGIIRAGQEMIDAAKAARKNADATDEATDAVEKFAGALSNIPRVLNVNALRHMVTGGGSGGGKIQPPDRPLFTGNIYFNINGAGDPRRVAEEVGRVIERTGSRGGMSRLKAAIA